MIIVKTKLKLDKRLGQQKKEYQYSRMSITFTKHIMETLHDINWDKAQCLETERRLFPRKIIERIYIKKFSNRDMNFTEGMRLNWI